jgi:glycosyltransferase involved in cell wall biosynthesis
MRISYLLSAWGHTGGSMVLYNFMDKLCERGHTVHAITPQGSVRWRPGFSSEVTRRFTASPSLRASVQKRIRETPVGKQLLKLKEKLSFVQLSRMNKALVRNWVEADITIATYCATAYAGFALSEKTVPLYHMQHWEEVFFADEFQRSMARLTYRLPLGLIANSTWMQQTVRERVGRESWLLLPGVDTQLFQPWANFREKFSAPRKIRIVSYYSSRAFKGWPDGLEAMKKVFAEVGPDRVEWLVYGGAPKKPLDVPVKFVGTVFGEALAKLYSSAHIVFMSSWFESFPLPPIEAMASGAAVVVTGTGTEDYIIDGVNGLVRSAKAPEVLAKAILSLVENTSKAQIFAEAGLETVKCFSWEAATDQLEAVLDAATRSPNLFLQPSLTSRQTSRG